jgi:HK97 gp10 family phage protein
MSRASAEGLHGKRSRKGNGKSSLGITLQLDGFEEVIRQFDTLEAKLQKKGLTKAQRAGANVIAKDARKRAHKLSGNNRKFIKVKAIRRSRKAFGVNIQTGTRAELGIPADAEGYYPFTEEYGSKDNGAHPYMRPALATKREEATNAIGKALEKEVEKAVKKGKKVK